MNQFSNIDFSFRRGTKVGLDNAAIKNGSLNFSTDTEEMFVDIDDRRLQFQSVVLKDNETQIRQVQYPGDKLFIARDTGKMLINVNAEWIFVGINSPVVTHDYDGLMTKEDKIRLDALEWEGTQDAYDLIVEKDPTTTYFINDGEE